MVNYLLKYSNKRASALAHYLELGRIGKVLASPQRLHLLDLLRQGPQSVEVLASQAGLTVPNTSRHLQEMSRARLLTSRRRGHFIDYALASEDVSRLFGALRDLAEAVLPEMDRLRVELEVLDEAQRGDLLRSIRQGEVTVVDVRPEREFRAGHIPGARSLPLDQLPARLGELPREREVLTCCRGPYCPMAGEAAALLREAGFRARALDLGPPDLRARGLPLEVIECEEPRASTSPRASPRRPKGKKRR